MTMTYEAVTLRHDHNHGSSQSRELRKGSNPEAAYLSELEVTQQPSFREEILKLGSRWDTVGMRWGHSLGI